MATLIIVLCLVSTVLSLRVILRFYHEALYWDQWFTVPLFDKVLRGGATLQDYLAQHNEHRILLPRLVFVLDMYLTSARNGVNFAATFILQALHVVLFDRLISLRVRGLPRFALTSLVVLLLFSAVQSENFDWGFQVQFVLVFLLISLAAFMLATAQEREPPRAACLLVAAGFACGIGAVLTMSNGAAGLCCVALVFAGARLFNRLTLATALLGAAVLATYGATFRPNNATGEFVLGHPLAILDYVAVYLGSFFAPLGLTFSRVAGLAGLAATCALGLALLAGRLAVDRVNLTLVAIIVFLVATAAITALGRTSLGIEQALASRYATTSGLFWTALVILAALQILKASAGPDPAAARTGPVLVLVAVAMAPALISSALAQHNYRDIGRKRFFAFERASVAILSGAEEEATALFPHPDQMKTFAAMLKSHRLNIFADAPPWALGSYAPEARAVADAASCSGSADAIKRLDGTGGFEIQGWAWDMAAGQPFRRLIVLAADRQVVGFGATAGVRSAAAPPIPGVRNPYIGWTAFARGGGPFAVYGIRRDKTLCRVGSIEAQ